MTDTRAPHSPQGRWELIGPKDCPILFRWTIVARKRWKLMVHRFQPNSRDKDPHDHPRPFLTFVLRGGYDDMSLNGEGIWETDKVRAPAVRFRRAKHAHVTLVQPSGAFTICVMGPLQREWGFFRDGAWWPWRRYEEKFGLNFHCEDD